MKRVSKKINNVPNALLSATCIQRVNDIVTNQQFSGDSYYYGHNDVKEKLGKLYNNKCAFCETDITSGAYLEVEHYRPKKEAKNKTHLGYYWLAHEWTNLLYACRKCNGAKSTHFPLAVNGIRASVPILPSGNLDTSKCKIIALDLQNEYPLLLNPEIDKPREHIKFLPQGKIKGITNRGVTTIKVCKLDRKSLRISIKKLIDDTMRSLMKDLNDFKYGGQYGKTNATSFKNNIWNKILEIAKIYSDNQPYSTLALTLLQQFEVFFINRFQPKDQIHFQAVYNDLKQKFNNL